MQRFQSSGLFAVGCFLFLTDCGAVLWTQTHNRAPRPEIDGAILSYALAEGTLAVQAEIKKGELTLVTDQKVVARPDSSNMYAVVYSHSPFSKDEINIQLESGLVKSISSTTADKSVEIVKGITSLLSQVWATKAALEQAAAATPKKVEERVCADMKVTYIQNVTYDKGVRYITKPAQPKSSERQCTINFTVTEKIVSKYLLGVRGFPRPSDSQLSLSEICEYTYAFCFRLGAIFRIDVTADVYDKKIQEIRKIGLLLRACHRLKSRLPSQEGLDMCALIGEHLWRTKLNSNSTTTDWCPASAPLIQAKCWGFWCCPPLLQLASL